MSRLFCLIFTLSFTVLMPLAAHADTTTYRFDPVHTQITFFVDHQGFSHASGRFKVKEGWFQFDPNDWNKSHVDVTIDMNLLDLGDEKWEKAAKGGPFLDTKNHPTAHFVSRSVEKTGENSGLIHGELTLTGKTKPIDITFTLNRIASDPYAFKRKAGFSAQAKIRRGDFGMTRFQHVVGEEIELHLEIEGLQDRDAASNAKEETDAEPTMNESPTEQEVK